MKYDVVVIGGGVVGCAVAWRLAQDDVRVCLVERRHDVAEEASKANSGIAATGYDTEPGSLETELLQGASPGWEHLCEALDVPFRRIGTVVVALNEHEVSALPALERQARANGVGVEPLTGGAVQTRDPLISTEAQGGLLVPGEGIIDPLRLTIGYAELAARNGAEIRCGLPATGFRIAGGRIAAVQTADGELEAAAVVNAAGLQADAVSALAGAEDFRLWPRKGEFLLLDRELGAALGTIVASVPTEVTRGVLCLPTTNGSLLVGPSAEDRVDRNDRGSEPETLARVWAKAQALVPSLERGRAIKAFAGLRPAGDPTYRVERSATVPNLIHAAAIRSTGVSSSPSVAERVRRLVGETGIALQPRADAMLRLEPTPRLFGNDDPERLCALDPQYRQVVCACEQVTAAEINAALAMRVPARSLDGIRKRTRAMGGRCQGAVCAAGCSFLLSMATGQLPWELLQGESALGVPRG